MLSFLAADSPACILVIQAAVSGKDFHRLPATVETAPGPMPEPQQALPETVLDEVTKG